MSAIDIDGKALAAEVQSALKERVQKLSPSLGRKPGLAVVLVGENPASQVYVRSKTKRAQSVGMEVIDVHLPANVGDEALQGTLKELSGREDVDGILLQLPLPEGLNEFEALLCIDPEKDADGLHPVNQGLLLRGAEAHRPCTPKGCMQLIEKALKDLGRNTQLAGLHATVVGRSILVGKPMALLLLNESCTVSVCHSRTQDLEAECARADILVAAVGRAEMIGAKHVKEGAIVIDVGINRTAEGKLVGDVDYTAVRERAAAITPVPGGVGPMTIAMLLENTVNAAAAKC